MTPMGETAIIAALSRRYAMPQFAFFPQVRNAAGFDARRTVDAVAVGLWPSRGLEIHGFEVKSYRGDWLRELKHPAKAEDTVDYFNRWWIVAANDSVAAASEIPVGWGLQVVKGKTTRVVVDAAARPSAEPDRSFVAALLRRAAEKMVPAASVDELVQQKADAKADWRLRDLDCFEKRAEEAAKELADFKRAFGVDGQRAAPEGLGTVVKAVLAEGHLNARQRVLDQIRFARADLDQVERLLVRDAAS